MSLDRTATQTTPGTPDHADRATNTDTSYLGGHAAARGMSTAVLQRKIQRRAQNSAGAPGAQEGGPAAGPGGGEQEDANVVELKTKIGRLVSERYGNDYHAAFNRYDSDHDGAISRDELGQLLKDAGVGNGLTRGAWASGIIEKMDRSKDGKIQWAEFQAVLHGG